MGRRRRLQRQPSSSRMHLSSPSTRLCHIVSATGPQHAPTFAAEVVSHGLVNTHVYLRKLAYRIALVLQQAWKIHMLPVSDRS